jgi:glycosyltransferase involved in cell wall biosynthesis
MRLALVAIVKDEQDCIERMLKSVAGISDEMIVVDTGSSDATPDIAAAAGARLFRYQWDHSFSNARNFALSRTNCPWRFVLDADEWLEDGTETLLEVVKQPPSFVGQVNIKSTFTGPAQSKALLASLDRVSRLLPAGVIYRGEIHEQPSHRLPVRTLSVLVNHDGYQAAKLEKKGARNLTMLKRALAVNDHDDYLRFQYARELKRHGRLAEAVGNVERVIGSLRTGGQNAPWREDAICLALEIFSATKDFSTGLSLIEKEAESLGTSVDFWFGVGVFSFTLAEHSPQVAIQAIDRMEAAFSHCLELGRRGYKSRIVLGRESRLASNNLEILRRLKSKRHP